jgi:hypothetical protein
MCFFCGGNTCAAAKPAGVRSRTLPTATVSQSLFYFGNDSDLLESTVVDAFPERKERHLRLAT